MNWNEEPQKEKYGSDMIPFKKQILVFVLGWLGFQVIAIIIQLIAATFFSALQGITPRQAIAQASVSMLINATAYIVLLVILIVVTYTDIPKLLKSFKQWQSLVAGAVCLIAIYAFDIFWGNVIRLIPTPVTDNVNQTAVASLQSLYPITSIIIFGFVAPVCEEVTYRVGLFSLLKRKSRTLAYAVTIIVFTLIHSNFTVSNIFNEFMNLPYYAFAAFAFSYTYDHYGFAGSVTAHILNNLISCLFAIFS